METQKKLKILLIVLLIIWTGILILYILVDNQTHDRYIKQLAIQKAHAVFNKDFSFRRWVAEKGGIYIKPTPDTPPNPYLSHLPDRDLTTEDGINLTLMNPAYAIRQIMENYEKDYGIKGRITSLNPLNPINEPTEWEKKALETIEETRSEVIDFYNKGDEKFILFMHPLITEQSCLKCHAHQGYTIGEVRGGIAVNFSLKDLYISKKKIVVQRHIILAIIWFVGVIGMLLSSTKILKGIQIKERQQLIIRNSLAQKEILLKEIHHRVKNNLQIITSLIQLQLLEADKSSDEVPILVDTLNRISTIAEIHKQLYQSKDMVEIEIRDNTARIFNYLSDTFDNTQQRITLNLQSEEYLLSINIAIPISLIITEIFTNIFKYAYPEEEGVVDIIISDRDDMLYIIIEDHGKGIPESIDFENHNSLGFSLIKNLVIQINGTITLERNNGTKYTLEVPIIRGDDGLLLNID